LYNDGAVDDTVLNHGVNKYTNTSSMVNLIKSYKGKNPIISQEIEYFFNKRLEIKRHGNIGQIIYKLLMNSSYGKTIENDHIWELIVIENEIYSHMMDNGLLPSDYDVNDQYNYRLTKCPKFLQYIHKTTGLQREFYLAGRDPNMDQIESLTDPNLMYSHYVIKARKSGEHFEVPVHVGGNITATSKVIMDTMMTKSVDKNAYYTDTDSEFITEHAYTDLIPEELIGSAMGQFHSDFACGGEDPYATSAVFINKKCYCMNVQSDEGDTDVVTRLKGVPQKAIDYMAGVLGMEKIDMYRKMIKGEGIDFPLALPGQPRFNTNKSGDIRISEDVKEVKRHIKNNDNKYVYTEYYNATTFWIKHRYDVTI
jgi:hypothetical protein